MAHILIIEHDTLIRQALACQLTLEHTFESTHDIAQATETVAARSHQRALLNLELGPEDGKALVPLLRGGGAPVLAYSTRGGKQTIDQCRQMGVAGLLVRGNAPLDVAAAVRRVLMGDLVYAGPAGVPPGAQHAAQPVAPL